jgi:hypothetical protein
MANKEDNVKGKFWESRFKAEILLDDASIVACMAYVDLNLIRAGLASTPENSDFTSIQVRILNWHMHPLPLTSAPSDTSIHPAPESDLILSPHAIDEDWLCPIHSTSQRCGILQMTETEYFDLVDRSGRILHSHKTGAIDPHLDPILLRIGANPLAWHDTISHFGTRFHLAAGKISSMREFAQRLGKRWFVGLSAAKAAFSS